MKTNIVTSFFLFFALIPVFGKSRVIVNPAYEVKNSGIDDIVKIELSDTSTRIHLKTTFIPGWRVKFPKTTFIQIDGSDEKILATGIEKGEFDKEIFMPASGDSLFVLVFPPLDKSVKKISYGVGEKTIVFGVSLEKNNAGKQNTIPADVQAWLDKKLKNAKIKEALPNYQSENFFLNQKARLVGYIKGYDSRLGFNTGIIYTENIITREDYPTSVNIHPNGLFEADIPMNYPSSLYLSINEKTLNLYLEPGHTLSMVLDWEEFLIADRLRNISYVFKDIEYKGALANINNELLGTKIKIEDWQKKEKKKKSLTPEEFKSDQQQFLNENLEMIRQKQTEQSLSEKAVTILTNAALLEYGTNLLDYVSDRKWALREDSTNEILKLPITDDFYDFLQRIPMNDQALIIPSSVSIFINRFEYCDVFFNVRKDLSFTQEISLLDFIEKEHKETWTDEDEKVKKIQKQLESISDENEQIKFMEDNNSLFEEFQLRHKREKDFYREYFNKQFQRYKKEQFVQEVQAKDSVLTNVFHLSKPNLIFDITIVRSLKFNFENFADREDAENALFAVTKNIQNPFVKSEGVKIFNQVFPENNETAYDLPETEAGKLFSEMIKPFKGKYILVDFWESWCGPCVGGIKAHKELREKQKESDDIAFLFICSEETPINTYNNYVEEQSLFNSHRLTKGQYIKLRELFKFNGIPHYETVDRNGKIMIKGLNTHNLKYELGKLLESEKKEQP